MSHALIKDGVVLRYPYNLSMLRDDHPDVSFPADAPAKRLAEWGIVAVAPSRQPDYDPLTQDVLEAMPVEVDGVWTQAWIVVSATEGEAAARRKASRDAAAAEQVKADNFVATFIAMTPDELDAYIEANATTVASLRALLKKMALMLLILARRGLH